MIICENAAELEKYRTDTNRIAFVPTMGALHAGHLSLVDIAARTGRSVIVSLYVNPTQFAPNEDFEAYPRNTDRDVSLLRQSGVDCVFLPREKDIYPNGPQATIKAGPAAQGLESDFRPHFFDGVCTVVHRLFALVKPQVAVFGEKDYQQLMVIREMVAAHGLDIEILGGPIIRDEHGLALSSRNAYLSEEELAIARRLNTSLRAQRSNPASDLSESAGDGLLRRKRLAMTDSLLNAGFTKVDYIEERWGRILASAWVGGTRLIDNIELSV